MPYVSVAGERLFYALVEDDPTRQHNLVLVHGAGGEHTHWPAELRRLAGFNVCALDLPAHGRSGGRGRTAVEAYADSVHLFLQTLAWGSASLVGHSMGGAIAQVLALRRPAWLAGVVLLATGARLRVDPQILEGLNPASTSPGKFRQTIDTICQRTYGPTTSEQMLRKGRQQLLSVEPATMYADYVACDKFDVMDQVKAISVPTLIMAGTADLMTPLKYGQYLRDQIPKSGLVEIRDGGHMLALEKPLEVTRALAPFLTALSSS
jgi:pimeloyl-ACP methyl ester carboxylesterase